MSNYKIVNLSYRNIRDLREEDVPKDVQILNLSYNRMFYIPEFIFRLKKLKYLILTGNRIHKIPNSIVKMTQLIHLDLSYNKITKLPLDFNKLINLNYLNLDGNDIKYDECKDDDFNFSLQLVKRSRGEMH